MSSGCLYFRTLLREHLSMLQVANWTLKGMQSQRGQFQIKTYIFRKPRIVVYSDRVVKSSDENLVESFHQKCNRHSHLPFTRDKPTGQLSLVGDLLDDVSIGLDNNLVDLERGLDGLGLLVNPLEFLQRTTLGFDTIRVRIAPRKTGKSTYPNRYQQRDSNKSQPTKIQK